ncbi:MAG: hypothetical protein ACXVXP_00445 [Mycobacteriaceae bacterium]
MASAKDKLAAVTAVPEPKDVNYPVDLKMWTYREGNDHARIIDKWDFTSQATDVRLTLSTQQASTVEIDLEDDDFQVLDSPLFANWAFNIQDVSLSSQKKFKTTRLSNSTSNAYLGDNANLEWVLGQRPIDFQLGDVYFRLCAIASQQTTVTLTFEDRVASLLRDKRGHLSWDRSQHTRAEFVAMLCRQAGVPYWIPELKVAQPVAVSTSTSASTQDPVSPSGKGLSLHANLTILGRPITQTQINTANILLSECHRLNAPLACWQAIIYAGIGETRLGQSSSTYTPNSAGAIGVLQGTNPYWKTNAHDTAKMADCFLQGGLGFNSAIAMAKQGLTDMAEIAVKAEVPSIWPDNAYAKEWPGQDNQVRDEVDKIVNAFGGPVATGSTQVSTTSGSYAFTRGPNEDSWDCIQRLASEVAWYAFVRQNRLWFVSGNYLFSQAPQMTAERGKNGIDYIDIDLDMGARDQIAECMVYGRTDLWAALPGMVVSVLKRGPATGKWFVAELTSHPLDLTQQVQVSLQKPVPKRAEPADVSSPSASADPPLTTPPAVGYPGSPNSRGVVNPIPGWTIGREDMGVDASPPHPGAPIYAPAASTLVFVLPGWYRGQPLLLFKFDKTPPGAPTAYWYVAEQITPVTTTTGTRFAQGAAVAHFAPSGTGIEIGWGSPTSNSRTFAGEQGRSWSANPAPGQSTPDGASFKAYFGLGAGNFTVGG